MRKNAFAAGAPLRTPLGELTELPRPPNCILGERSGERERQRPQECPETNSWLRLWKSVIVFKLLTRQPLM